jgi:hypothetical protein
MQVQEEFYSLCDSTGNPLDKKLDILFNLNYNINV